MSLLHNKIYFEVFLFLMLKYEKHLTTLHVDISKHQKWRTCDFESKLFILLTIGCDRMVVGCITIYAISARCEFESRSDEVYNIM